MRKIEIRDNEAEEDSIIETERESKMKSLQKEKRQRKK